DDAAGVLDCREQGVPIGVRDLARPEGLTRLAQFVAGRQHEHPRTTHAANAHPPCRGEHADQPGSDDASGGGYQVAATQVTPGCAKAGAALDGDADFDAAVALGGVLDSD